MDLDALLGSILDPIALGERVIQQLQDRLVSNGTLTDISDKPPEELIATLLSDWLARRIGNEDPSAVPYTPAAGNSAVPYRPAAEDRSAERLYKELSDRNIVLAAALGACGHCWGTHADCPFCGGAGVPGWVLPNEELYANYVHPAVRAVANSRVS